MIHMPLSAKLYRTISMFLYDLRQLFSVFKIVRLLIVMSKELSTSNYLVMNDKLPPKVRFLRTCLSKSYDPKNCKKCPVN